MNVPRWAIGALVLTVPLAMILPAVAQREGGQEQPKEDVNIAREIVRLIEEGQLSLTDATQLAEKHVKGEALRANCHVEMGDAKPAGSSLRPAPGGGQPAGKHLVYDVTCFAKEKGEVQEVKVDGLTRKVLESSMTPSRP
ncbi:MAG: hypothetical protein C4547_00170 [Phycisphaerales bacterium]|nr:MAG: hypothetical protein C4547_00170 [Phycisphaerales bacterium]